MRSREKLQPVNGSADEGPVTMLPPGARSAEDVIARSPGGLELGYLALLTGKAVQDALERAAVDFAMPPADLLALYVLGVHDGLPGSTLARLLRLQQPTITALADRLESAGLITRVRDTADRRRVRLCPTAAGQELLGQAGEVVRAAVRDVFAPVHGADAQQLAVLLGRVVEPWLSGLVAGGRSS
jgi:DNA-binding MarR family transcriptional regulator